MKNQSTNHLFMIEPEVFHSNDQTLASNHYQSKNDDSLSLEEIKEHALIEFNNLKSEIEKNDLKVTSMKGIKNCPDHIFPNWFITFDDSTFQLFSMKAENRRLEKTHTCVKITRLLVLIQRLRLESHLSME